MNSWLDDDSAVERHIRHLHLRSREAVPVYRCVLRGFQRFVRQRGDPMVGTSTLQAWLQERAKHTPVHMVLHRARIVDRFLDFLQVKGSIASNPLADLRARYGQRCGTPIVRALLASDCMQALEALRPAPRFGSFLGEMLRQHVGLMHAAGYRYEAQAGRLLRFDRFLQGRPELAGQRPEILLKEWAALRPTSTTLGSANKQDAACFGLCGGLTPTSSCCRRIVD